MTRMNTKSGINYLFFLLAIIMVAFSCSTAKVVNTQQINEVDQLQIMMSGSYDSSLQAEEDSSYYNISLHMYPIWENKGGGKYLYVEQAMASMQDKPYRQRVYKLQKQSDGKIASFVYTLKNDSLFIGKWKNLQYFEKFGLSILDEREGCEVILTLTLAGYEGSTQKDNCKSTLRGASYATSVVSMTENQITSWDQGFDEKGDQVWGATKGPYKFVKLKE